MAKGFKFPAPKGFAKGGMCSPKGAKGYAKGGGPIKGTNIEASDLYDTDNDMASVEAGRNVPRITKNPMRSESTERARMMRKTMEEAGEYASGGKVAMKKMKSGRTFAKIKKGYADGGEVETEQTASKATRVKMPRGAKAPMQRAKAVPVASRQPMIQPQAPVSAAAPLAMRGPAPSPLSRVASAAPRMGMKMGGKAKKC
ncbi:MAG: hypothetical protein ACR2IJ_10040 [Fluviibacter sp.]